MEHFELDTQGSIEAIAEVFELDPGDTEAWRLDRFGADLGDAIVALANVVFAPRRKLLSGPRELIIDVHAIIDLHDFPLVVCLWQPGAGAFIGSGVEDARELVVDPLALGPAVIIEAMESLLEIVTAAYDCAREPSGVPVPAGSVTGDAADPAPARASWRRWTHPRVASTTSGGQHRAVLSFSG